MMSSTRIAVIERPNGTFIKRGFAREDAESAQQDAIRWLEQTFRPRIHRFVAICFPEYDVWPEGLDLSDEDLRWLRKIRVCLQGLAQFPIP